MREEEEFFSYVPIYKIKDAFHAWRRAMAELCADYGDFH